MALEITALVLTRNERENIARTLSALSSIERIQLIDSGSTDGTLEIARQIRPNVQVAQRRFDTHTQQWNFGLDQVTTEWVLTLDADYQLSPEVQAEMVKLDPPPDVVGYAAEFEYRIFGHPLRASSYPPRVVLFRAAQARYVDDGHTQLLKTDGRVENLVDKIYHDDRKSLSQWLQAQDRYMTLEARHLLNTPRNKLSRQDRLRRKIYFAPVAMFLYLLFGRGLVLDGWPGWYYVMQRTIAEMLLSLRLLTVRENLEPGARS